MGLLDFAGERVVVALGTVNPRAVNDRGDRLGDLLMLVAALVEEPDCALVRGPFGPSRDHRADDRVPRPMLLVGTLQKGVPAAGLPPILAAIAAPAHEQGVPDLAEVASRFGTVHQPIDQGRPLIGRPTVKKRGRFLRRWNAAYEIDRHAANERAIVAECRGLNIVRLPARSEEAIDRGRRLRGNLCLYDCRCLGFIAVGDPGPHLGDVGVRQLFFRRHVRIGTGRQHANDFAFIRLAHDGDRPVVVALPKCRRRIEPQPRFLVERPVALHAIPIEHRLYIGTESQPVASPSSRQQVKDENESRGKSASQHNVSVVPKPGPGESGRVRLCYRGHGDLQGFARCPAASRFYGHTIQPPRPLPSTATTAARAE